MNDRERFEDFFENIKKEIWGSDSPIPVGFMLGEKNSLKIGYQAAHAESAARLVSLQETIGSLEQKLEGLEDALKQVNNWCKAYPIEVFTEPDWDEVKDKLGSTLLTQVSGSNMRHITTGITKIIDQAITNTGDKT